jgi:hypothetical protein
MPVLARSDLESLLRSRKLDATLIPMGLADDGEQAVAPAGLAALDARLGGGWPRGQLSELVGPRSSGRTRIALASLAAATRRGELAALVDTFDEFDPQSAAEAVPVWPHFLWVRGSPLAHTRIRSGARGSRHDLDLLGKAVDRAIKAAGLVLAAGGFGLLVVDLADAPLQVLQHLPFTTWLRIQRMLEGRDTACLLVASEPLGRSAGGVSLRLAPASTDPAGRWQGTSDRARRLVALDTRARIVRARLVSGDLREFDFDATAAAG